MNIYKLFFDGACNPNPSGEASFGYQLLLNNEQISFGYGIIGHGQYMNDLLAEYTGLLEGLHSFLKFIDPTAKSVLNVYGDSQFVIKQLNSHIPFRLFDSLQREQIVTLMALRNIKDMGVEVNIEWVSREQNQVADRLAKLLRKPFA